MFTGDHLNDRRDWPPIDDAVAEGLLAGGEITPDLEPVAGLIRALRESARRRVVPSARLAARMAGGWPSGSGTPPARASAIPGRHRFVRPGATPQGARTSRLMAWAGAAGLVAAIVGTATAGFARALPEPAQQQFDTVVQVVTGHDFPDRPDDDGSGLAPVERPAVGKPGDPGGPGHPGSPGSPGSPGDVGGGPSTSGGGSGAAADPDPTGSRQAGHDPDVGAADGADPTGDLTGETAGLGSQVRDSAREGNADGDVVSEQASGQSGGTEGSGTEGSGTEGGGTEGSGTEGSGTDASAADGSAADGSGSGGPEAAGGRSGDHGPAEPPGPVTPPVPAVVAPGDRLPDQEASVEPAVEAAVVVEEDSAGEPVVEETISATEPDLRDGIR
jgi:hypothetical protein